MPGYEKKVHAPKAELVETGRYLNKECGWSGWVRVCTELLGHLERLHHPGE